MGERARRSCGYRPTGGAFAHLVTIAIALVAAGCGASPGDNGLPPLGAGDECRAEGSAQPLTSDQVTNVLRRHGFSVEPSLDGCSPLLVEVLTNTDSQGPSKNIDEYRAITRREGHLGCSVELAPILAHQPATITEAAEKGLADERLILANVMCSLYLDPDTPADRRDALRAALTELQGTLPQDTGS